MHCEIKRIDGTITARGKNLRVLGDYARKTSGWPSAPAVLVNVRKTLIAYFADGAVCVHEFADAGVLAEYVRRKIACSRGRFIGWTDRERFEYPAGTFDRSDNITS